MKNELKQQLKDYLIKNGRGEKLVDIYNMFPYHGHNLTNKQKGDRVRSVWRKIKRNKPQQPKILVWDVENSPLSSYCWGLWKQNINPTNGMLRNQSFIICFAAKWLYSNEMIHFCLTQEEILNEDDSRIIKELHKLLNKADVLISHNGKSFDNKVANTRFIMNGLPVTTSYQTIDTLLHARKAFRFPSNKLDYLGQVFGLGKKNETSFELWRDCLRGDLSALNEMNDYCIQDVKLLEAVYLKMRPYIKPHPNFNLLVENTEDTVNCPTCGSTDHKEQGVYTTYANKYPQHQCNSCGSTFRSRKAIKIDKTNLTISTPTA